MRLASVLLLCLSAALVFAEEPDNQDLPPDASVEDMKPLMDPNGPPLCDDLSSFEARATCVEDMIIAVKDMLETLDKSECLDPTLWSSDQRTVCHKGAGDDLVTDMSMCCLMRDDATHSHCKEHKKKDSMPTDDCLDPHCMEHIASVVDAARQVAEAFDSCIAQSGETRQSCPAAVRTAAAVLLANIRGAAPMMRGDKEVCLQDPYMRADDKSFHIEL